MILTVVPTIHVMLGQVSKMNPIDVAWQLLKERVSPEAKRHKLEYDKQYESSPERVKYREDLNRERRRRGIYGSHDGKLTLEGEHENRARHFKEKGTLRDM
jgi:inner membrane protein involved in colicin E2 resistance